MTRPGEDQENLIPNEETNQTINDDENDSVATGDKDKKKLKSTSEMEQSVEKEEKDKPWYCSRCFILLIMLLFCIAIIVLIIVLATSGGGDNPTPNPPTPDPPTPDPPTPDPPVPTPPAWCTGTNVICVDDKVYNVLIDGDSVKIGGYGGKSFSAQEVDTLKTLNGVNTDTTYSIFETIDAKMKTGTLTNGTASFSDGPITATWTGLLNEAGQPYGVGNLTSTAENGPYFVTTTMIDGVQTGFRQDYTYRVEQVEMRAGKFAGKGTRYLTALDGIATENLIFENSSDPTSDVPIEEGDVAFWLPIPAADMPIIT